MEAKLKVREAMKFESKGIREDGKYLLETVPLHHVSSKDIRNHPNAVVAYQEYEKDHSMFSENM